MVIHIHQISDERSLNMVNRKFVFMFMFCVFGCFLQMFAGCSNAESDWERATVKNTPEAYREYAIKYPSSKHIIRAVGNFTGHSIMVGDDGILLAGLFGSGVPEFEIRSASIPDFMFKMSFRDATTAGLLKNGRLELAAIYTYTDGEMIVLVNRQGDNEIPTLVYFKCTQSTIKPDNGEVKSSKAKKLSVALLRTGYTVKEN